MLSGKVSKKKAEAPDKRALIDIIQKLGPGLLQQLRNMPPSGQLKLYRGMSRDEANAILWWAQNGKDKAESFIELEQAAGYTAKQIAVETKSAGLIIPLGGHLGGRDQAENYSGSGALLEFVLKPGAHELLFSPGYMAVQEQGHVPELMHAWANLQGTPFRRANPQEGNAPGYVGVKSESKGPFSLTIGENQVTPLLFQLFIESVAEVGNNTAANAPQGAPAAAAAGPG